MRLARWPGGTLASIALTRDAIGRVTAADRNLPLEPASNAAAAVALDCDAANQIAGDKFDARGRLMDDNAGSTYHWSAHSRLISFARPDSSASFYDGLGQRISRTDSGETLSYLLNYGTFLPTVAAIKSGQADPSFYVYTPDGALIYSVDSSSGAHRFYSFDDAGSTTFLSDDKGAVTDTYGITLYGEVVAAGSKNATKNSFTWQGRWGVMQEPGTSLFYARFRYYDSSTARFLSRDPVFSLAPTEMDPYQYASGDPVANTDPAGLKPLFYDPLVDFAAADIRSAQRRENLRLQKSEDIAWLAFLIAGQFQVERSR